jgi:hypothetical protein
MLVQMKTLHSKKHVYIDHCMIAKIFEEEISNLLKKLYETQLAKKISHVIGTIISNYFDAKDSYKN